MANETKTTRTFNICVVGLSGIDEERSLYGTGKSCLCNRFVRPAQDDFIMDHTSVFSASDFGGSVINNNHYLYWGAAQRCLEDGSNCMFQIVEQSEFIDDSSFLPITLGGQLAPYFKRSTATKLSSPGKLMYISRDQVAIQSDYEQVDLPEGKFKVDGFLCVYDVSLQFAQQHQRTAFQEEILSNIITHITKSKKPYIIVATKCDEADETLLANAHRFVHTRKIQTPLVETSALDNINVSSCFNVLAQLIDSKIRVRTKITHYQESQQIQQELTQKSLEKYQTLVRSVLTDLLSIVSWCDFQNQQKQHDDYKQFILLCGTNEAERVFSRQVKKLKQHYADKKLNQHLSFLPDALDELLPTLQSIENSIWKWEGCQRTIRAHKHFTKWFRVLPEGIAWNDKQEILSSNEKTIPFDVLQLERSRACFDRHVKKLMESAKKLRMKSEFRKLLELTTEIRPGTSWSGATLMVSNEETYRYLDEHDRKIIFETYLQDITLLAKLDFQELLFESAPKFVTLSQNMRPSDVEMKSIYEYLKDDSRFRNLESVGNARDILLFNHIALMASPTRCLSGPEKCMDRLMQEVVELTGHRPVCNPYENDLLMDSEDEQIGILVIGRSGLAHELKEQIQLQSSSSDTLEYIVDGQIHALDLKVIDQCDTSMDDIVSITDDFNPQGYLAIYSDLDSLDDLCKSLKRLNKLDDETDSFLTLPVVLMLACEQEDDIHELRKNGQLLAEELQCLFVDFPYTITKLDGRIHESQVQDAIRGIVEIIRRRTRPNPTISSLPDTVPDLRILLCAMCGDHFPVELILGPLLHHQSCYSSTGSPDTIMLETYVGPTKRNVSITLTSYHRAYGLRNSLYHGYILVYSATRKASLEMLSAFSMSLLQVPIQVLAVTGSASGASVVFHNDVAASLLANGTNLASRLSAKFQTTTPSFQHQTGAFATFFNSAFEKRFDTELLLRGIRRRKQDPLPDVPSPSKRDGTIPNGAPEDPNYSLIPTMDSDSDFEGSYSVLPSLPKTKTDASPTSPDRMRPSNDLTPRKDSRSSTIDSRDDDEFMGDVPHDDTGLYALPVKVRAEMKAREDTESLNDDEDDQEIIWQNNSAYGSSKRNIQSTGVATPATMPTNVDRHYATVPYPTRPNRHNDFQRDKFATIGDTSSRAKLEPEYASIDQVCDNIISPRVLKLHDSDKGYEPGDSLSSLSSKSKDSIGSGAEGGLIYDPHMLAIKGKIAMFDPSEEGPTPGDNDLDSKQFWFFEEITKKWILSGASPGSESSSSNVKAPLAKPEDDNEAEFKKVRQLLKDNLIIKHPDDSLPQDDSNEDVTMDQNGKSITQTSSEKTTPSASLQRGADNESHSSSLSLTSHYPTNFMRKMIRKMSPVPSPVNSEGEHSGNDSTGAKKKSDKQKSSRRKSLRHRKRSPPSSKPPPPPEDAIGLPANKTNSLPSRNSKRGMPQFNSLDFKRNRFPRRGSNPPSLVISDADQPPAPVATITPNEKSKKNSKSKDDFDLPADHTYEHAGDLDVPASEEDTLTPKPSPDKKLSKKTRSLRLPHERMREKKKQKLQQKSDEWERKKRKDKVKQSNYFGRPLDEICLDGKFVPSFVEKCISYVEAAGLYTEGIYRISGNKQDVEMVLRRFEEDKNIVFEELNVSVHAITGALKQFFQILPDPIIPAKLYQELLDIIIIMDAHERLSKLRMVFTKIPKQQYETFKAFMFHLINVKDQKAKNKMDVRNLAIVVFPTLMRPDFSSLAILGQNMNMWLFIQTCIEQWEMLFNENEAE